MTNEEKPIEEMAKDIEISDRESVQYCHNVKCKDCHYFYRYEDCYIRRIAEKLVDKGYRRASDVAREIFEESYDYKTLADWYISSVDDSKPVWSDAHISELLNDFYIIPKEIADEYKM